MGSCAYVDVYLGYSLRAFVSTLVCMKVAILGPFEMWCVVACLGLGTLSGQYGDTDTTNDDRIHSLISTLY